MKTFKAWHIYSLLGIYFNTDIVMDSTEPITEFRASTESVATTGRIRDSSFLIAGQTTTP